MDLHFRITPVASSWIHSSVLCFIIVEQTSGLRESEYQLKLFLEKKVIVTS